MITTLGIDSNKFLGKKDPDFSPNALEFDVTKLELDDDGKLIDKDLLDEIVHYIEAARKTNDNGVIVTLFAHGWHHGGKWDDKNFISFRKLLASLSLREAERYDGSARGRRVIGIYLAWNGDPEGSNLSDKEWLTHLTFWNRYKTAKQVGAGEDLYKIFDALINVTKSPLRIDTDQLSEHVISPLILTGHSMGAILVELAFLSVLKGNQAAIADDRPRGEQDVINLKRDGQQILAPDLVLALNSAAESEIAIKIKDVLAKQKWQKIAESSDGQIRYNPPVMLSVTSKEDKDTGIFWRIAKPLKSTDGNNCDLHTHTFTELALKTCNPRGSRNFGQSWHCVRRPEPAISESPGFFIDLPYGERHEDGGLDHMRYELRAMKPYNEDLAWIFKIPGELCKDHNDIFNERMASLVLSLIQISGAVMSLANEWKNTFEYE